jgi:hypothetical protein
MLHVDVFVQTIAPSYDAGLVHIKEFIKLVFLHHYEVSQQTCVTLRNK